jgi:hypothetical protein
MMYPSRTRGLLTDRATDNTTRRRDRCQADRVPKRRSGASGSAQAELLPSLLCRPRPEDPTSPSSMGTSSMRSRRFRRRAAPRGTPLRSRLTPEKTKRQARPPSNERPAVVRGSAQTVRRECSCGPDLSRRVRGGSSRSLSDGVSSGSGGVPMPALRRQGGADDRPGLERSRLSSGLIGECVLT